MWVINVVRLNKSCFRSVVPGVFRSNKHDRSWKIHSSGYLGYSNLKSADPRRGVGSVINILFWIIRGFLVCVPSRGGAAFLRAGRLFLAEAQEKAIGESLKSPHKRSTRRRIAPLRRRPRPAVMTTDGCDDD